MNIPTVKSMRDIKFRVWDVVSKKFTCSQQRNNVFSISLNGDVVDGNGCPYDESHIPQQYTGKKDINERDMYEGDLVDMVFAAQMTKSGKVVKLPDSFGVYEIFYKDFSASFYLRVHKKNWFDGIFVTEKDAKSQTIDSSCPCMTLTEYPLGNFGVCRVIGNIYENPELLK